VLVHLKSTNSHAVLRLMALERSLVFYDRLRWKFLHLSLLLR
jgi:hypothetical protein